MIRALCITFLAAAAAATYVAPEATCWTETRKCRWEAKSDGYKCKDYYDGNYARCHPLMKYKKVCDEPTTEPKVVPEAPAGYTNWNIDESELISYSKNYGPHIKGYPKDGMSKYYDTAKLPKHPKGYTSKPAPPPTAAPTAIPYKETAKPTAKPTEKAYKPTTKPTKAPKYEPTVAPTTAPTMKPYAPTVAPTAAPTKAPKYEPTVAPTAAPKYMPTATPEPKPYVPTAAPTAAPTKAYVPTAAPTKEPSLQSYPMDRDMSYHY